MINLASVLNAWSFQSNSVTRQVNFKGQKLVENAKIEKVKYAILGDDGKKVLSDSSILNKTKIDKNAKIQMRHFWWFSNTMPWIEPNVHLSSPSKIEGKKWIHSEEEIFLYLDALGCF